MGSTGRTTWFRGAGWQARWGASNRQRASLTVYKGDTTRGSHTERVHGHPLSKRCGTAPLALYELVH